MESPFFVSVFASGNETKTVKNMAHKISILPSACICHLHFYEKIRQYVDEHRGKEKRTEFKFSAKEIRIYLKMKATRCYEMLTVLVRMEYLSRIRNFHKNEGDKYRLTEE